MSEVRVRENESLESALKRFKRSCAKSGVLAEVRKREHYESPSVKRRKKSEAARKNRKKFYQAVKPPQYLLRRFLLQPENSRLCRGNHDSERCGNMEGYVTLSI